MGALKIMASLSFEATKRLVLVQSTQKRLVLNKVIYKPGLAFSGQYLIVWARSPVAPHRGQRKALSTGQVTRPCQSLREWDVNKPSLSPLFLQKAHSWKIHRNLVSCRKLYNVLPLSIMLNDRFVKGRRWLILPYEQSSLMLPQILMLKERPRWIPSILLKSVKANCTEQFMK